MTSDPITTGTVSASPRNSAARRAEISGYVMDTVMARASPSSRVLSKNAVSPIPTAAITEIDRRTSALADIDVSPPAPPVATSQQMISTPATVERMALTVAELKREESWRTRRLVIVHASADPEA